jgi:ribonucleotide reductase beta subunit family protein with ferritin-like domain
MDLIAIKKDIEEYIKISTDNKITSLNSEQPVKMSPQQFLELTMKQNLIHTDNFESKIEDIAKVHI